MNQLFDTKPSVMKKLPHQSFLCSNRSYIFSHYDWMPGVFIYSSLDSLLWVVLVIKVSHVADVVIHGCNGSCGHTIFVVGCVGY